MSALALSGYLQKQSGGKEGKNTIGNLRNKWDDRCAAAIARAAHPRRASRPPHRATPLPLGGSS